MQTISCNWQTWMPVLINCSGVCEINCSERRNLRIGWYIELETHNKTHNKFNQLAQ